MFSILLFIESKWFNKFSDLKVVFNKKTGDWVTKFEHNGNLLGYALFDCDSHNDYSRIAQAILENLGLEIKKISNKGGTYD